MEKQIKRTLFERNERYTNGGDMLDKEVTHALQPIFEKWFAMGYSAREIEYIMTKSCTDLALERILDLDWHQKS